MSFKTETLFNVKGKIALITGGSSGIGLVMAKTLVNNGAIVYICQISIIYFCYLIGKRKINKILIIMIKE